MPSADRDPRRRGARLGVAVAARAAGGEQDEPGRQEAPASLGVSGERVPVGERLLEGELVLHGGERCVALAAERVEHREDAGLAGLVRP